MAWQVEQGGGQARRGGEEEGEKVEAGRGRQQAFACITCMPLLVGFGRILKRLASPGQACDMGILTVAFVLCLCWRVGLWADISLPLGWWQATYHHPIELERLLPCDFSLYMPPFTQAEPPCTHLHTAPH